MEAETEAEEAETETRDRRTRAKADEDALVDSRWRTHVRDEQAHAKLARFPHQQSPALGCYLPRRLIDFFFG